METPTQSPPPMNDQQQDEKAVRVNRIWKAIAGIWTVASIGLCFWWMFDESGLSETICGWQAAILDGSCYVMVNFVGAFLILMLPVILGQVIVQKVTGVKIDMNNKP